MFARYMPAPFLSAVIRDCIEKGRDYYDGGPRYNTTYVQCCGIGTVTDSLSAIRKHVFEDNTVTMERLLNALHRNFEGDETLRLRLQNKTPRFGNDDDDADGLMQRVYESLFGFIDGRPNTRNGKYHLNMLSTTCHVYFGSKLGASADGRFSGMPESDGASPSQGADRRGPTAVCRSLGKMDQIKSGGTLLNQRFLPQVFESPEGLDKLVKLVQGYFSLDGHHIQFNVVDSETLREAQKQPEKYRDLLVRVAGYSDYFVDLGEELQEEVISRTVQGTF
jgi:formate C-acetyltransferase